MALAAPAGQRRKRTASRLVPYVFLAPAMILFAVLFVLPIGYTVWQSLHTVKVSGLGFGRGARKEIFAEQIGARERVSG